MTTNKPVTEEIPIATYQGASDWGPKYGILHYFTLQQDYPERKLVKGSSVTSKMVIELGGDIISLDKLKKGDNVYTK